MKVQHEAQCEARFGCGQERLKGLLWWLSCKETPANAGDMGSVPESGRSPGGGNGNPLQYSCLEDPMETGAWWAAVHGATQS